MKSMADDLRACPVLLAPMAGISDLPFRRLVAGFGVGLVVSEMIASREIVTARPSARARAALGLGDGLTAVQIAGCEAHWMAEAARFCEGEGARIIDINMGCPAKKVTAGWSGSALMRDPDHALRLIGAVVSAVSVPVTVKMRLGWDDDSRNAHHIAARAAAAGVRMVTVHGRTRCQFYTGRADWAAVAPTVLATRVPVVVNGDIGCGVTARKALAASGAVAVMVGRAARARPWLPAQIAARLAGRAPRPAPSGPARAALIAGHYEAMLDFYGIELGGRVARKHLGWYLDDLHAPAALRREILTTTEPARVLALLSRVAGLPVTEAEAA